MKFKKLDVDLAMNLDGMEMMEEMRDTLWECASGPNDFNFNFFNQSWHLIGKEIFEIVVDFR